MCCSINAASGICTDPGVAETRLAALEQLSASLLLCCDCVDSIDHRSGISYPLSSLALKVCQWPMDLAR